MKAIEKMEKAQELKRKIIAKDKTIDFFLDHSRGWFVKETRFYFRSGCPFVEKIEINKYEAMNIAKAMCDTLRDLKKEFDELVGEDGAANELIEGE